MTKNRTDFMQSIGTIAALLISIVALFTSIYEASILKSQQKSLVWPYVSVSNGYSSEGFEIKAINKGTGPAIIKSMEVYYNNQPVGSVSELIDSLKPDRTIGYDRLFMGQLNQAVLRPGEEALILGWKWTDETREITSRLEQTTTMKLCYESVLGESWTYDSSDESYKKKKFRAKKEFENR